MNFNYCETAATISSVYDDVAGPEIDSRRDSMNSNDLHENEIRLMDVDSFFNANISSEISVDIEVDDNDTDYHTVC